MKEFIKGANPYMPLWEHVPDGEPRVFEYNGEKRVYVYGSHDIEVTQYCGRDYVVWSAPVDDLTNWICHGVAYKTHYDSVLYAPDVVKKGDTYYMYAAERCGSLIVVASSKTPWGPFENPVETKLGFDPGVLVDEDGKVYAYWGGCAAPCYIAELEEDMATIKEETLVSNPLGHSTCPWNPADDGHISLMDGFFEASSPRKVMGKYVYIYSKRYEKPVPELGVYTPNNGFLSYRFSESPFGPFHDGGDISFNGGEILKDAEGCGTMTYQWGNNHGSIMEINGTWYVFYHRQTGVNEYSRQAMLEPVDVAMGQDGKLYIGNIKFLNGEPVASGPVEMTSQGPHINGLDAYKWISAGYACHIHGSSTRAYIRPGYEKSETISTPVVDLSSGTTVGFRYLQFGNNTPKQVQVVLGPHKKLTVNVRTDSYQGRIIASMDFSEDEREKTTELISAVTGKHAVYFEFLSEESGAIAEFDRFCFDLSSINHIRLEMDKTERAELTVLCLLCHGDSLLLQNRVKEDWKGYALPGGHVEPGESFVDAVIREMKEETGLTIRHPKLCGIKQFPIENGRYIVLLFQTDEFSGELVSSEEGKMEWVQRNRLSSVNLVSDLRELLRVMEDDSLTEFQYVIEENEWKEVLK